jgi:hypothetical protein
MSLDYARWISGYYDTLFVGAFRHHRSSGNNTIFINLHAFEDDDMLPNPNMIANAYVLNMIDFCVGSHIDN